MVGRRSRREKGQCVPDALALKSTEIEMSKEDSAPPLLKGADMVLLYAHFLGPGQAALPTVERTPSPPPTLDRPCRLSDAL